MNRAIKAGRLVLVTLGVAIVTMTGCYKVHLIFDRGPAEYTHRLEANRTFVLGIVELDGKIGLQGICESGLARVEQSMDVLSIMVAIMGDVVQMRQARVFCLDGQSTEVWQSDQGEFFTPEMVAEAQAQEQLFR